MNLIFPIATFFAIFAAANAGGGIPCELSMLLIFNQISNSLKIFFWIACDPASAILMDNDENTKIFESGDNCVNLPRNPDYVAGESAYDCYIYRNPNCNGREEKIPPSLTGFSFIPKSLRCNCIPI